MKTQLMKIENGDNIEREKRLQDGEIKENILQIQKLELNFTRKPERVGWHMSGMPVKMHGFLE